MTSVMHSVVFPRSFRSSHCFVPPAESAGVSRQGKSVKLDMASASNNFRCLGILAGASVSYKADSMFLINLTRTGSALLNAARLVYLCSGKNTRFYMKENEPWTLSLNLISYTDSPD